MASTTGEPNLDKTYEKAQHQQSTAINPTYSSTYARPTIP